MTQTLKGHILRKEIMTDTKGHTSYAKEIMTDIKGTHIQNIRNHDRH